MIDHIQKILQEECQLSPKDSILLGVSGGPDSICLLHILWRLEYPLVVAHLDHQLRSESSQEAQFVAEFSRQLNVPFIQQKIDVKSFAEQAGYSIEEAARVARYRFLFDAAEQYGASTVATGHSADDQVETVLMHFLRGSGLDGLTGMPYLRLPNPWSKRIPHIRPLLANWREQILQYIQDNQLQSCQDLSNLDLTYYRNRLRHELLPILKQYNPGIHRRIWQMSDIIRQDQELIEEMISQAWSNCCAIEAPDKIAFTFSRFSNLSPAIQRYLIRRAAQKLRQEMRDFDYNAIQQAVDFVNHAGQVRRVNWIAGLRLSISLDIFWIGDEKALLFDENSVPVLRSTRELPLPIPGQVTLSNKWMIRTRELENPTAALEHAHQNSNPYQAWIDPGSHPMPLKIRTRKPGDRLDVLGMQGHSIKLSDLMIDNKIPHEARATWPLIIAGDQIVWVPGIRLSEAYRLRLDSLEAVFIELIPPG